eukprot:356567-Chlamydomonas_euryale.AAC.5
MASPTCKGLGLFKRALACGRTGLIVTGMTGLIANGVTGLIANGVTGLIANGVTSLIANGVTGLIANGVTDLIANGVTAFVVSSVSAPMPVYVYMATLSYAIFPHPAHNYPLRWRQTRSENMPDATASV